MCPGQAHRDAHLYVALRCIPLGDSELQWVIELVVNLGTKTVQWLQHNKPRDLLELVRLWVRQGSRNHPLGL